VNRHGWLLAGGPDLCLVWCRADVIGDVDPEVAGEPGQAVGVALPDGTEAPRSVAAVDLEADERGFYGGSGLEDVLGGRAGCGGGDDEVVDVGEATAVDADGGHDPVDVGGEVVERDVERFGRGCPARRGCGVADGAIGGGGLVVEDEVRVGSDPSAAVEQDGGGVEVVGAGAPADGESGGVEGDVLARAQLNTSGCGGGLFVAGGGLVGFGVAPVVGGLDAGFEACVFAQEVEQVGAVEKSIGLPLAKSWEALP
jgi:hypothetical protein